MSAFCYRDNQLCCEGLSLAQLADQYGTPFFVYSANLIATRFYEYTTALAGCDSSIHYAVKANSNLSLLAYLHQLGAHFDVVSGGELQRVLMAGAPASHIHFAGVGKSTKELRLAIEQDIGCICLESVAETERLLALAAAMDACPRVAIRINPAIEADTHQSIRTGGGNHKFGIAEPEALALAERLIAEKRVQLEGISCHLGSQILTIDPFVIAAKQLRAFYLKLAKEKHSLSFISMGGGFGIAYQDNQQRLEPRHWQDIAALLADLPVKLVLEPGRSLVAEAGALVSRVEYLKQAADRKFVIVDAAMNDLLRPSLYQAYHRVLEVRANSNEPQTVDIVGPVCETGDWLARNRKLSVSAGDLVALMDSGAYAMAMSSNYNSRGRLAELFIKDSQVRLIRRRETIEDQWQLEQPIQRFD